MKRIRNPDTGRFHTIQEAAEAVLACGGLAKWVEPETDITGEGDFRGILEIALDPEHDNCEASLRIVAAALPLRNEAQVTCHSWLNPEREGWDYYTKPNCPTVAAFEKLMAPMRALLQ